MYESMDKMVSHPSHYNNGGIETIEYIKAVTDVKAYDTGQVIKYISRWDKKHDSIEGQIQDVEKTIWYATHLLETLRKENENVTEHTSSN